jgi:hypothetical protein
VDDMPETWPWVYFVHTSTGWLRFYRSYPWSYGISIQIALALVAVASVGAEVSLWWLRSAGRLKGRS